MIGDGPHDHAAEFGGCLSGGDRFDRRQRPRRRVAGDVPHNLGLGVLVGQGLGQRANRRHDGPVGCAHVIEWPRRTGGTYTNNLFHNMTYVAVVFWQ